MGWVLAIEASHNGHPLSDVANVGNLALIGSSTFECGWLQPLQTCL